MSGPGVGEGMLIARISAEPLDVSAHLDAVDHPTAGASTIFVGRVRDHDPEVPGIVVALEYEAHPDAERILIDLAARLGDREGTRLAVSHRTGTLRVGDVAVVVAVSSAHRAEAFEVCRAVIEAVKTDVPIWKRQIDVDGRATWSGLAD